MRIAIIDLGTNSVRFDIQEIESTKTIKTLHREKLMVRLGQGVFLDAKLDPFAIKRTTEAFIEFKKTADKFKSDKIIAFATSALREAKDRDRFLIQIKKKTGIEIKIISGIEEAKLISTGILANESAPKGRYALVDIGGGSTEITVCRGKEILFAESFNVGTARLQQMFIKQTPPKPDSIEALRRYIKSILLPKFIADDWPSVDTIVGSSGTIRALTRIATENENADNMSKGELKDITKKLCRLNTSQLLDLPGMESRRVDMITGGAVLLDEITQSMKGKKIKITTYSLRDGILQEEIKLHKNQTKSHVPFHVEDLLEKACLFGGNREHLKHSAELGARFFELTKGVHKLPGDFAGYIRAAMILRNVGESISYNEHEDHSAYIVKNLDFYSVEDWETQLIGELCGQHEGTKPEVNTAVFPKSTDGKGLKSKFTRLLAVLRIADALDTDKSTKSKIKSIKITSKKIEIKLASKSFTGLERLRLEQKQPLFMKLFKKQVVLL